VSHTKAKVKAILEVVAIFAIIVLGFKAINISPLGEWENQVIGRYFLEYALVLFVPMAILIVTRRSFSEYGIDFKNLGYHLKVVVVGIIPIFVLSAILFFLGWDSWKNTTLVSIIEVILLVVVAWMLRNLPAIGKGYSIGILLFLVARLPLVSLEASVGIVTAKLVYTFIFVALGEEILFRGYIQSRVNETFGRPRIFFGVNWGWGVIIGSLLFGIWHILNPFNPFIGQFDLMWKWGLWTFFLGLILGFIREKTGSVLGPAILHGFVNF
jgi:membrane protease YdiL (CAAX protease family)